MKSKEINNFKLSSVEKHETNPFIFELKGKMYLQPRANTIIAKGQKIIDTETGEVINDSILIGKRKMVDKSQFAKIYASEIGKIYNLSQTSQKVFMYLTTVMDYDNKAFFNYNTQFKIIGYKSFRTPFDGIKELIKNDIIAPAIMPHYYWMNPTIVCKGERFAVYTEYIKGDINPEISYKKQIHEEYKQLSIFPDKNPYKKENNK